jgi:hypothetical protein
MAEIVHEQARHLIVLASQTFTIANANKKRPRDPSTWRDNAAKHLKTHGEAYVNRENVFKPAKNQPSVVRKIFDHYVLE